MTMAEIREKAAVLGLTGIGKLRKVELIQQIQLAEGNNPCYGAEWRHRCAEMFCCWRSDCLKD
jgi:hypothetical protein